MIEGVEGEIHSAVPCVPSLKMQQRFFGLCAIPDLSRLGLEELWSRILVQGRTR